MVEAMEFGENNLWLMMYGWKWRLYSSIGIIRFCTGFCALG
jgi:hypothetical protein